jgi:pyruvate ferredoxin oxidoreductase gamma subunit
MIEIRWHGRGGQGAKTGALLLADCMISAGKYATAFPEYGPERMGAPVVAFNRINEKFINLHCGIKSPDVIIILDPSLIEVTDVTEGLSENGIILVNTKDQVKERLKVKKNKVYTVDASGIAKECLGRDLPNTPMLGAVVKVLNLISIEKLIEDTKKKLEKKFKTKPEIVDGNLQAIRKAYNSVREEV